MSWPLTLALAALHGALFFASFHPLALFPLAWVAFAPFALLVARGSRAQALAGGFLATFLGGGSSVYWLALFGTEPWLATAFGFGLYGLFMAAVGRALSPHLPSVLWLPLAVASQEYLRGHLFFCAFPWVFLGHSQVPLGPFIQAADLGGAILLSAVLAAFSGGVADLRLGVDRSRAIRRLAGVLAAALALSVYGALRERSIEVVGGGPRVLAVQGNIPQNLKNQGRPNILGIHEALSIAAGTGGTCDLVVWPETMVLPEWHYLDDPAWIYDRRLPYASLAVSPRRRAIFARIGRATGAHALVGSLHAEIPTATAGDPRAEARESNSAFFLDPKANIIGRYDKMYPAPMSECTPFYESWPWMYRLLRETFVPPGFSQFTPGREVPVWPLPVRPERSASGASAESEGTWRIAASVCFDITFPAATNEAARSGADAIVNVSNYAWFEDSSELDLARVQTIFRAIETRRGVVSVCNGGISCFVDPRGRCEDLVGPDSKGRPAVKEVQGTMIRPLTTSRARTLVVALGEWPGALATALALGLAALFRFRRKREVTA